MNLRPLCIGFAAFSLLLAGCSDSGRPENVIETEEIKDDFKLHIQRLDMDLFHHSGSLDSVTAWHQRELATSPYYATYLKGILMIPADSNAVMSLYKFSGIPQFQELQKSIEEKFPNTDPADAELTKAFGRLSTLLPKAKTPAIVYFNSGFSVGIWPDSNFVGVGLEWYLGPESKVVKALPPDCPQWLRNNMSAEFIPIDAVKAWLMYRYDTRQYNTNVLEKIVFQGKVRYAAEAALSPIADSTLMSYTKQQMDWCYAQEDHIYKELIKNNMIFSTKDRDMDKLTQDGPFTPGFPQDGAPMAGVFIGWKMVADYMKKNPDTSLEDLLTKVPAREILKAYKPKK